MTTDSGNNSIQTNAMESSQLMKLFEDALKNIYWAENALTKAIPQMITKATSEELIGLLSNHLKETQEQVVRLEKVFESYGRKAVGENCEGMKVLLKEAEWIMESCEAGIMCDARIISAAKKIEQFEITAYGILRQFAENLGLTEAELLLQATLDEEKKTYKRLTEITNNTINRSVIRIRRSAVKPETRL